MASWTMNLPVPVEFGAGSLQRLEGYLGRGYKAFVVTYEVMRATGVIDRIRDLLETAGIESLVFDRVSPEPKSEQVEEAAALAREFGADVIVGCGGGSALDAAKATAVAATHPGSIMDYVANGPGTITEATLPNIAISSTSGTGSHVSRASVVSDRGRKIKRALFSDYLYPRAAICDPEILRTMPPEVTAATGFDAFAHALEGYLSREENPMGILCAQEAMRIIHRALPRVIEHGDDLDLRLEMAWADTLAGISLATNAVVIPHEIGMVLGGRYGISHSQAIASVLVACLEHSRDGAVGKLANVARLLGCMQPWSDDGLADWAIKAVKRFIASLGLAKSPSELGVPETDFDDIAREVRTDFASRIDADPVPTDAAGLARILRRSVGRRDHREA
jgi:alcohol dehydrogenase class IV